MICETPIPLSCETTVEEIQVQVQRLDLVVGKSPEAEMRELGQHVAYVLKEDSK